LTRVLVTGAARGLGLEFGRHLVASGFSVIGADLLDAPDAGFPLVRVDVTSPEGLAEAITEELGGLDALVNNAAVVDLPRRPFSEIPEEEWDRVMSVNVKGTWLVTRAVVPLLREAGGGSIVNIASEVAFSGSTGLAHYVASKGAVVSLTRVLARELGPDNIRVNAIAPGYIPTEASSVMAPDGYDATRTPLGRVGTPQDLLGTLEFLVSDASAFVTGQTLLVNGGRLMP
jgi:NAD(P)-dependent dehydrogenase (short-subunit alcohol dehydrogenase family)